MSLTLSQTLSPTSGTPVDSLHKENSEGNLLANAGRVQDSGILGVCAA